MFLEEKLCAWLVIVLSLACFKQFLAETKTNRKLSSDNGDGNAANSDLMYNQRDERSLQCIPMIKHFEVELEERLRPGEGVGLTGDHVKLGQWQIGKSLEMKVRRRNPLKWYLKVPMCSSLRVYYRFFIYYKDSMDSKRIRMWEGQQHARVLEAYEVYRKQGSSKFGRAHDTALGGGVQKEKGWLREEYVAQLKFIWPQHIRFTLFSHFIRSPSYNIRLSSRRTRDSMQFKSKSDDDTDIEVSSFIYKNSHLRPQSVGGEFYKPGKILVFHITTMVSIKNLYTLTISSKEGDVLGTVDIPASLLVGSEGILELPIYDTLQNYRVGWLTLPYVIIKPMPNAADFNMRASFLHFWPHNWPTLDVGHRGVGKSFYYHSARAIENTIKSFLKASDEKSDMVELDIQLTKDYVPVVWNERGFYTAERGDKLSTLDLYYAYISEITYDELVRSRVFVYLNGAMVELSHLNSPYVDETERIFPTLKDVFKHLPLSLGIIIEVKWPQLLSSGSLEYLQSLDKNQYVDAILVTSIGHSCGRPLIFSSFDADICSMIRFKQHMFPVILLTVGQHSRWESYADLRTVSLISAIHFVQSADILGTAIYADGLFRSRQQLEVAFQLQQVLFVWGDILNNSRTLANFRKLELAGMIYDHVDENIQQRRKRFGFFEAPELKRIFLRQCVAAGNISIIEGAPDTHSPFWPRLRSLDEL